MNVCKQLDLQQQLQLHLNHVKTNGKPKNVIRGKIRGTVPRKRSKKTAKKLAKFANHDVLSLSENTFSNFSCMFLNPNIFSNLNSNWSKSLDTRNLQEPAEKSIMVPKIVLTFHSLKKLFW